MGKYYTLLEFSHDPDLDPKEMLAQFNEDSPVTVPEGRFHHELYQEKITRGAVLLKRRWDAFRVRRFLKRSACFIYRGSGKLNKNYLHSIKWGI
jgi:hypothetical protein